ncbi:MAG: hypothetical protein HC882_00905 [Acidobacteria bacterium]|nr:hypothetical protein [Acidobacteriota bacterium]
MKYTHADVYPVHYFQTYMRIDLRGGLMRQWEDIEILCGAQEGEAVDSVKKVTCRKCLEILEQKERK